MAKSKEKEVDWAKFGKLNKPLVDHITQPKQGVGTGKSVVEFQKKSSNITGSVMVRNVSTPQKPIVPDKTSEDFDDEQENDPEAEYGDSADYSNEPAAAERPEADSYEDNYEVNEMETKNNKKSQGRHSDNLRNIRPPRKENKSKPRTNGSRKSGRDMHSGMELLGLEFLLSIVEDVNGDNKTDVTMRKLCFNELIRTDQRSEIDSKALKIYGMDADGLYGKDIQCQALEELAERTSHH